MQNNIKNIDENKLEEVANNAQAGFDTKGKPIGMLGIISIIISVVVIIIASFYLIGGMFKPVRNCIGSISGAPECSDCTTALMNTTVNGKSYGKCTANPGTGKYDDQCTLNCSEK